jgi:hypothetical protein
LSSSAAFHFDAQASLVKKNIAAGATTTATLDDTTGVSSVLWTVTAAYGSSTSDWPLSSTTGTSTVVTAPAGSAKSCILQCKVNGGVQIDPVTGRQIQGGQTIRTAKIYLSPETIVTGETTESDATNGWSPIVNAAIVGTSGTTALSGTALNLSEGGDSLSLTRPGSNLWLMTAGSGDSIKIDSAANITLDVGGASGTIDLTHADVSTCALVLDSDGPLTCTVGQAVTSVTFGQTQKTSGAGAAWTMRAQQGQAGQVGGALVLGGGNGGTPGTNAAGSTRVKLGTPVAGATAGFIGEREDGTVLWTMNETSSGTTSLYGGSAPGSAALVMRGLTVNLESNSAHIAVVPASDLYTGHGTGAVWYHRDGGTVIGNRLLRGGTSAIGSATTTTVASFTTTSNRVYEVEAHLLVSNDTDNEGANYVMFATFKNVAGTVSQIGSTSALHTAEDAGQTGLSAALDFSGTALRVRLTTDAADTVNYNADVTIRERVLA